MSELSNDKLARVKVRLESLSRLFADELRSRGFDPAQIETAALPTALANMYVEKQRLEEELTELTKTTLKETFTMTEIERIVDQFKRAFDGEAWHGPSVLSLLSDVPANQAASHPIPGAHSIWELVLHIEAWERACKRRLEGDRAQLSDDENFPPVTDMNEKNWEQTKTKLIETHKDLLEAISKVDERRLDEPIIRDPATPFSTVYVTLQGGVQHDLYHAGQIAILKKALGKA